MWIRCRIILTGADGPVADPNFPDLFRDTQRTLEEGMRTFRAVRPQLVIWDSPTLFVHVTSIPPPSLWIYVWKEV